MESDNEDAYETPLEPIIVIDDGDEDLEKISDDIILRKDYLDLMKSIGPDISIIPIKKKKPSFKIRLLDPRGRRGSVRLISEEEAKLTPEPYQKRKSLPLEKCPVCKKFFRRMSTHLLKHEYVDSSYPTNGLTCHYCNKSFNTHSNLLIHIRTHTGQKPYVCQVCNKAFSQSCNLVNHMRIHSGEKPFKCPHCDKAFTQSGNLTNHIRLHTNEKPFRCHFCDKAFVQSGNLNSHIKNNHRYADKMFSDDIVPSSSDTIVHNMSEVVD
ncbi:hypothetical protein WA026_018183 [Henosepilachna vigintioctopunctata]|uniref:C2H2-type domain-containing protein n=1 Tax=Henosepilachna vigintioctopunctata TaxID=420089 RepID=A0AAW1UMG5_9CUCU